MKTIRRHSGLLLFAAASIIAIYGCSVDEDYKVDSLDQLDTEITLFEKGLEIPVGSTQKIKVDSLVALAQSVSSAIKTAANGTLAISMADTLNLDNELKDLDMSALKSMDGVNFTSKFDYDLSELNPNKLLINGLDYNSEFSFETGSLSDIDIPSVNKTSSIKAGLDQYSATDKLDLTSSLSPISASSKLIGKGDFDSSLSTLPESDVEMNVQKFLKQSKIDVSTTSPTSISVGPINLHENISEIKDVKFNSNARVKISLSLSNCFLTKANVTPNISLDLSKILDLKDEKGNAVSGPIKLDKVLNETNGWSTSYSFPATALANKTFKGSSISMNETIPVSGTLSISDAYTTPNNFKNSQDVIVDIHMSFENFVIESAMATLAKPISVAPEVSEISFNIESEVPEGIKKVDIVLDETKPLALKIAAKNLSEISGLSIVPSIEAEFPSDLIVKGATEGKLSFTGDLAKSDISENIVIESLSLTPGKDHKIAYNGAIKITSSAKASGTFDIAKLPTTSEKDVTVDASVQGKLKVKDYQIQMDAVSLDISSEPTDVDITVSGFGEYGTFIVTPKGSPAITLKLNIPHIKDVTITAGSEGIMASFPEYIVFDASGIDSKFNFNQASNSITIKGEIPNQVVLPIKHLSVTPVSQPDGSMLVKGQFASSGKLLATPTTGTIDKEALEAISKEKIGYSISIPEIKAESIEIDGSISFPVEYSSDDIVIIGKDMISNANVKEITDIEFDNANIDLSVSLSGLPDVGDGKFRLVADIKLPEFLRPSTISIDQEIDPKNPVVKVTKKLEGVNKISVDGDIKGKIVVDGKISATNPKIDFSTISDKIEGTIKATVGNADGKIAVKKIKGKLEFDAIDLDQRVKLGDLTSGLEGAELKLDINPEISLEMKTNLGFPIKGTITLLPYLNGEALLANVVEISNIELPYSTDAGKIAEKKFFIAKSNANCPSGAEFINRNLSNLLKTMPDEIAISVKAGVDQSTECIIEPSASYTCDLIYGINIPLSFGKDFELTVSEEMELDESIAQVLGFGSVGLKGTFVNSTPLNIKASIDFADQNGTTIAANAAKLDIKGCSASGQAAETPLDLALKIADKSKTKDIRKMKICFTMTATPDVPIKSGDFIQGKNLVLLLPEGITMNANTK